MTVNPDAPEPLYQQLAAVLRAQIRHGDYNGKPLPSVRALRETYDLGEHAVTHALSVLAEEGLIYSVPRRGYYVTRQDGA
jgi:DNA-binding GntR family transcriptional regulator